MFIENNELKDTKASQEQEAKLNLWLETIKADSLLPVVKPQALEKTIRECLQNQLSPRFVITLCPVFENISSSKEGGPSRKILPFAQDTPRLKEFSKEVAAIIVATQQTLGLSPNFLILINDIFEPGAEERIENIDDLNSIMVQAKSVLHDLFQQVDNRNQNIWPHKFQRAVRIVKQSDFVKPLKRFGLPSHLELVETLMKESLDPKSDAFKTWLWFLQNTRNDPLMSPNAWLTEKGASTIHKRVRFLVAMYWIDGIINPLLFKTVFQEKKPEESLLMPIFICGVTRQLQAEMEMAGPNLKMQESVINRFERIQNVCRPTSSIHIFKNTSMWIEEPQEPFSFGKSVLLR